MEVRITVRELLDLDRWSDACEVAGINVWAVNEGQMSSTDTLTLTHEQAWKLNLVTIAPPTPQPPSFT